MNKEEFAGWKHLPETKEVFDKLKADLIVLEEHIASGTFLKGELVNKDQAIQIGRYLGIKDVVLLDYEDIFNS